MLTECIETAIMQASLLPEQIKCIACGLSGVDTLDDARGRLGLLRGFLQQLTVPDHVRLCALDCAWCCWEIEFSEQQVELLIFCA